jgi:hypothetical protein
MMSGNHLAIKQYIKHRTQGKLNMSYQQVCTPIQLLLAVTILRNNIQAFPVILTHSFKTSHKIAALVLQTRAIRTQ